MTNEKSKYTYMKNKSYIGTAFIILVFGILVIPKIIDRIKNDDIVKGDRLNKVESNGSAKSDLLTIGKAPQFSLTDQNNQNISNESYKGKVYVVEFSFRPVRPFAPL